MFRGLGFQAITSGVLYCCQIGYSRPNRLRYLEVGDQVVVVEVMGSGQRSILRCEAANTAAGTSTVTGPRIDVDLCVLYVDTLKSSSIHGAYDTLYETGNQ